jgi:hypothetical protein
MKLQIILKVITKHHQLYDNASILRIFATTATKTPITILFIP